MLSPKLKSGLPPTSRRVIQQANEPDAKLTDKKQRSNNDNSEEHHTDEARINVKKVN